MRHRGLRVVDIFVMPDIERANTNLTCIMMPRTRPRLDVRRDVATLFFDSS